MIAAIEALVDLGMAYAVLGLVFAPVFLACGINRVDPQAKGSGIGFRLIVLPGVVALWPLILVRWVRGGAS